MRSDGDRFDADFISHTDSMRVRKVAYRPSWRLILLSVAIWVGIFVVLVATGVLAGLGRLLQHAGGW